MPYNELKAISEFSLKRQQIMTADFQKNQTPAPNQYLMDMRSHV